jgi:hypothetical protein
MFSVVTLDGITFYFASAATVRQLLEILLMYVAKMFK